MIPLESAMDSLSLVPLYEQKCFFIKHEKTLKEALSKRSLFRRDQVKEVAKEVFDALSDYKEALTPLDQAINQPYTFIPRSQNLSYDTLITEDGHVFASLDECLGKGAFKTVYKGVHLQSLSYVAIASFRVQNRPLFKEHKEECKREYDLQKKSSSKYVLEAFALVEVKTSLESQISLYTAYSELGDLFEYTERVDLCRDASSLLSIVEDVLRGLTHMHSLGIKHGDIKPENILLFYEGSRILGKISDFGSAREKEFAEKSLECTGTPEFFSPEYARKYFYALQYLPFKTEEEKKNVLKDAASLKGDLWSLGMTSILSQNQEPPWISQSSFKLQEIAHLSLSHKSPNLSRLIREKTIEPLRIFTISVLSQEIVDHYLDVHNFGGCSRLKALVSKMLFVDHSKRSEAGDLL